jgi:hypothetical protein
MGWGNCIGMAFEDAYDFVQTAIAFIETSESK